MPIYAYQCSECRVKREEVRMVRNRNRRNPCEKNSCHGKFIRRIGSERVNSTEQNYAKPILSDALGIHPNQIQRHKQLFPDVAITPDGRPILESHAHRKRVLKQMGFIDRDSYL